MFIFICLLFKSVLSIVNIPAAGCQQKASRVFAGNGYVIIDVPKRLKPTPAAEVGEVLDVRWFSNNKSQTRVVDAASIVNIPMGCHRRQADLAIVIIDVSKGLKTVPAAGCCRNNVTILFDIYIVFAKNQIHV